MEFKKIMKFKKKPVVIDAVQWWRHGDHDKVIRAWETPTGWCTDKQVAQSYGPEKTFEWPVVETLEGLMIVAPGDWIITGVKGEHYPCKPDIFALTYEEVDDSEWT